MVGGNSGCQHLMAVVDESGRWCLMVVMDDCCGSSGQWTIDTAFNGGCGGGVRCWWQHLTVFDRVGDGLWQGDGESNDGQHNERTRGGRKERQCNNQPAR